MQRIEDYVRDQYRSNRLIQAACTANALQTTSDAIMCGESVDDCVDDLPPVVESQLSMILAQASCTTVGVDPMGCPSRVSAMKDCLDALGEQLDTIELSATCAAFGSPVPPNWWRISLPSACTTLSSQC